MLACPEVDDEIKDEQGVGNTVEHHPAGTQVVVEKRYGNRQYNQVDEKRQQHKQVPVESIHASSACC